MTEEKSTKRSPCKGCTKRAPGCHTDACEDWKDWHEWQQDRKERMDKEHRLECALGQIGKKKHKGRQRVAAAITAARKGDKHDTMRTNS